MALPLLLGIGAGILGGTQFLMKRADERAADSMLEQFMEGASQSTFGQMYGPDVMALASQDRGFFDAGRAQRTESLLSAYANLEQQYNAAQAAQQQQMMEQGFTYQDRLNQRYSQSLGRYDTIQKAYRKALNSLGEGASNAEKIASLYNFFSIVDPGRAVQGNEAALFNQAGGLTAMGENWFRSIFGKGLGETTREEIARTLYRQFTPEYEDAQRQRRFYDDQWRRFADEGYNVVRPRPLGIDWNFQNVPPATRANTQAPVPEGYSVPR